MTIATGRPMLASDINDLTFFPKGTILTFSSEAWGATSADFKTIWKVCDGENGTPNLVNRFLRGGTSSDFTTGGGADSRSVTLTTSNLPAHTHEATGLSLGGLSLSGLKATSDGAHEHTLTGKTISAGSHSHGITDPGHTHSFKSSIDEADYVDTLLQGNSASNYVHTFTVPLAGTGITINNDGVHEHSFTSDSKAFLGGAHEHDVTGSISGGSVSGSTASAGSGSAFSVDTVPAYYTVIYIMKIA